MRTRTDALIDVITPRPEERDQLDAAYNRADSISGIINIRPTRPLPHELPTQYRRRLLAEVKTKSPKFKDMPTGHLSGVMLELAEDKIYEDAISTARNNTEFRPLTYRDEYGRLITTWSGYSYMGPYWSMFVSDGATVTIKRGK